jgi:hypothetical protein
LATSRLPPQRHHHAVVAPLVCNDAAQLGRPAPAAAYRRLAGRLSNTLQAAPAVADNHLGDAIVDFEFGELCTTGAPGSCTTHGPN